MRLAKMTTRRWIVAVAVVALVLGIVAFVRRRAQFRALADYHAETARRIRSAHVWVTRPGGAFVHTTALAPRPVIDYHATLAVKYEHAARYPWLPVEPDPPPPE
jgi:hypothetical protein